MPKIFSVTPQLQDRAREILVWLDKNADGDKTRRYVAIDDTDLVGECLKSSQMKLANGHFVRTNQDLGLTEKDVDLAVQLLNPA